MPKELAPLADLDETKREFVRRVAKGESPSTVGESLGLCHQAHNNLLRQTAVVWAIRVERQRLLATEGASLGYAVLMRLAGDETVNSGVRRQAARDLLALGGHSAPKPESNVNDTRDKPLSEMTSEQLRALVDKLDSELAERAKDVSDAVKTAPETR
jgi:hypothetical protein